MRRLKGDYCHPLKFQRTSAEDTDQYNLQQMRLHE
jgi:hypothetical protein